MTWLKKLTKKIIVKFLKWTLLKFDFTYRIEELLDKYREPIEENIEEGKEWKLDSNVVDYFWDDL